MGGLTPLLGGGGTFLDLRLLPSLVALRSFCRRWARVSSSDSSRPGKPPGKPPGTRGDGMPSSLPRPKVLRRGLIGGSGGAAGFDNRFGVDAVAPSRLPFLDLVPMPTGEAIGEGCPAS